MKEFDVALKAVAEGLRTIAQGMEKIAEKLEDSTPKQRPPAKPARKAPAKPKKTTPKKTAAKKTVKKKASASDTVLAIINRSKKGVNSATLAEKTGFDKKKIANIVFKLRKQNKIKSVGRGVYSKV
jgi:predicted Rossmann fold nucleotide-binding protein DprA/Smf involved in DNA uptake